MRKIMLEIIKKIFIRTIRKIPEKKILIIENRFHSLEFLNRVLSGKYIVLIAQDKDEGLNKAQSDKPDLIILNSKLNKERTLRLFVSLRNIDEMKNTPVLIIAEKEDDSNVAEFYVQKIEGFIFEPYSKKEILGQIQLAFNDRK